MARLSDGRYRCPRCEQAFEAAQMTRDMMTCVPCARAKCREYTARRRAEREARGERVRAHLLPVPADFAARIGRTTDAALGELYGVSVHVVRRWRGELGIAPARGALPRDFARLAAGMTGPQVAKRWGVSDKVAYRWLRVVRGPGSTGGRPARTAPADLAERALAHTTPELLAHYDVHRITLRRWLQQVGVSPRPSKRGRPVSLRPTRPTTATPPAAKAAPLAPPRPEQPSARPAAVVPVHTNGCRDCTATRLCRVHQTAQLNADIEAWMAQGNRPREVPQGATGMNLHWSAGMGRRETGH